MNGYPLKLLGCYYPPFMNFTGDSALNGVKADDIYFPLIIITAEIMNFSIKYIHCMEGTATLQDVFKF